LVILEASKIEIAKIRTMGKSISLVLPDEKAGEINHVYESYPWPGRP
jgi:hypothetical protein